MRALVVKAAGKLDPEQESLVNTKKLASFIFRRKGERQMGDGGYERGFQKGGSV